MVTTVTLETNQPDCLATTATKDLLLLLLLSLHDSEGINLLIEPNCFKQSVFSTICNTLSLTAICTDMQL